MRCLLDREAYGGTDTLSSGNPPAIESPTRSVLVDLEIPPGAEWPRDGSGNTRQYVFSDPS